MINRNFVYMFVSEFETNRAMNKSKQKQHKYNTAVVSRLAEKFGVTPQFVRMSIRGDRDSETSTTIKKEYKALDKKVKGTLKSN